MLLKTFYNEKNMNEMKIEKVWFFVRLNQVCSSDKIFKVLTGHTRYNFISQNNHMYTLVLFFLIHYITFTVTSYKSLKYIDFLFGVNE